MSTPQRHLKGCPCGDCHRARQLKKKQREVNTHRGIPNRVDPAQAIAHLQMLQQTMSLRAIARVSGCSACHLRQLLDGKVPRINRDTERRILAARPEQPEPWAFVDATGSVRRVRALQAIGHTQDTIARVAGTTQYRISGLARGREITRQILAEKIAKAYKALAATPGSSSYARRLAAEKMWHGPLAWGDDIDDPAAEPDVDTASDAPLKRDDLGALRRLEMRHLASFGVSEHEIADRLGLRVQYVHDTLRTLQEAA